MTLEHQKWLGDQISRLDSSWILRNLLKYLDHWIYNFGLWWAPKLRFKLFILVGRLKITASQISCLRFIMNFEKYVRNGEPLNVAKSNDGIFTSLVPNLLSLISYSCGAFKP